VLILHPYVLNLRPADQWHCWEALGRIARERIALIVDYPCQGDYDYADALEASWSTDEVMVIVEHDIAPTLEQVLELEDCSELFCSMDYAGPGWPSWAVNPDAACIGLAKLDGALRMATTRRPAVPRVHWHDVGGALVQVFGRPHIHPGPVAHYHQ
jgi:hypothetical protein